MGCFHNPNTVVLVNGSSNGLRHNGEGNEEDKEVVEEVAEKTVTMIDDDNDQEGTEFGCVQANTVLIRVYGNKTDLLIDRKAETRNIKMLHRYGFAPSLFATFRNGLAYEYVPGVTLKPDTVIRENIYRLVARQMAEMHKVHHHDDVVSAENRVPMIESKVNKFLGLIPDTFTDAGKQKR